MTVTAEQVKAAVLAAGVMRINHHDCSICGVWTYHFVVGDRLYYNSKCGCVSYLVPPRICDWQEAADHINRQSRSGPYGDVAAKTAKSWGITLTGEDQSD